MTDTELISLIATGKDKAEYLSGGFWNGSKTADCSCGWLLNTVSTDDAGIWKLNAAESGETNLYAFYPILQK